MTRARLLGALAVAAGVCIVQPAFADPITEFQTGTILFLRDGTASLDGHMSSTGGINIAKPANALSFSIPTSVFGLNYGVSLQFNASKIDGETLLYSVDQSFSPGVDIDGHGDLLTNVTGTFTVTLTHLPASESAVGNVLVTVVPVISNLVVTGTWGSKVVYIQQASFYAGYQPSTLTSFFVASGSDSYAPNEACSDSVPISLPMSVVMTNPAPKGGQPVFLTSAYHQGVSLPSFVLVPQGKDFTTFTATIAPNFVGTVLLSAQGNGAFSSMQLEIDPYSWCQPASGSAQPMAYNPDPECIACTPVAIDDGGDKVELVDRIYNVIVAGVVTPLTTVYAGLGPSVMTARAITDGGFITGMISVGGVAKPYRANLTHDRGNVDYLTAINPVSIGVYGTVVGTEIDPASGRAFAAYDAGTGTAYLPLSRTLGAYTSAALQITDSNEIVGTYTTASGTLNHGFRWRYGSTAIALPTVGSTSAIPIAANAAGQIAVMSTSVNALTGLSSPIAAVLDANNTATLLGQPRGYGNFTIKSMNKRGWVVGDAQSVGGSLSVERAFLWKPGVGFVALSGYSSGLPVADDVSHISDNDTIVVHGTNAAGVTNYYTLAL